MIYFAILPLTLGCLQKKPAIKTSIESNQYKVVPHPEGESLINTNMTLKLNRIIDVDGRQGVAIDDSNYYVSGTSSLHVYSKDGALLRADKNPFSGYSAKVNHFGDIAIHDGKLYTSAEWFENGKGSNMQIGIHDAKTLKLLESHPIDKTTSQQELSGLAIDALNGKIWLCSWLDSESGNHLYEYDLKSGQYLGNLTMDKPPSHVQGVAYHNGRLYLTADDGDALSNRPDHLFTVDLSEGNKGKVTLLRSFTDIKAQGEIEGLGFDPVKHEIIIHFNRGKIIKEGKPMGLLSGYTREIHELYIFDYFDE